MSSNRAVKSLEEIFKTIPQELLTDAFSKSPTPYVCLPQMKAKQLEIFHADLTNYFEFITTYFKHPASADDCIMLFTELLDPKDLGRIKAITLGLDNTDWLLNGSAACAYANIYSAIKNLASIQNAESPSLQDEKKFLEEQEVMLRTQQPLENKEAEQNRRAELKKVNDDLIQIHEVLHVASKLRGLNIEARKICLTESCAMLSEILNENTPRYISLFEANDELMVDKFGRFTALYQKMMRLNSRDQLSEVITLCAEAESLRKELIEGLMTAISFKFNYGLRLVLSPASFNKLQDERAAIEEFSKLLLVPESDLGAYRDIVNTLKSRLVNLIHQIQEIPKSEKEVSFREMDLAVREEADLHLPKNLYPYQLNGISLRKSKNAFVNALLNDSESRANPIANPNQFILARGKEDNLNQIQKDLARNLRIENKEEKNLQGEALKQHLRQALGEKSAADNIRHYDQSLAYLISGAVSKGLSEEIIMDQFVVFKQGNHFKQNLYSEGKYTFRNAEAESFQLAVPQIGEEWTFKARIKAIGLSSEQGYFVERVATDCPLICVALMRNESAYPELELMVTTLINLSRDLYKRFQAIKDQKGPEIEREIEFIRETRRIIFEFQDGRINFDFVLKLFREQMDKYSKRNASALSYLSLLSLWSTEPKPPVSLEITETTFKLLHSVNERLIKESRVYCKPVEDDEVLTRRLSRYS